MYCSKCGTKNNDDANFCWNCGAPLAKKAIESYTQAVELAMEGDERGFSYLYNETYKSKYYLALKYMDDKDAAEDVLQDAYIKAFSKLASLKEPETFPSWLGTIVANTAKNALQKKNPVLFTDLPSGEEDSDLPDFEIEDESVESQPEAAYTKQETEQLVHELINSLSEEQKMCILMYYIDGESVRDIAESLDCTESAVKSRLSYGRKNLKVKAEELQKKGYKLFTLAPIPLLLALVHKDAEAAVCEKEFIATGKRVAEEVLKKVPHIAKTAAASQAGGTGAAAHQAGTGAAAKAAAGAGVAGKGGAGAGAVVGFISSTTGKVVIFVVAVAVVTGAVVGGMYTRYVRRSEEAVVYEDGSVTEEPDQSGSDDTGTTPSPFDDASESETDAANDTAEANAPSVMSVQGLLELFPYMADSFLCDYYGGDESLKDGITSPGQVYWMAACATIEAGVYSSPYYIYVDGEMREWEYGEIGQTYYVLPTDIYEEYLRNMFGTEYDLSEFVEWDYMIDKNVKMDNGKFYVPIGEYGEKLVEVTVENILDKPDADGTYLALAKYSDCDPGSGDVLGEYYMLYRLRLDESSDYGCVIVDMIPAGNGEVDDSAFINDDNKDSEAIYVPYSWLAGSETDNESEENGTSTAGWKDMYRNYITGTLEFYDTDLGANCKYSLDPEGIYTFALIYLNDDDIPELLIFNDNTTSSDSYAYRLCTLRDGMFKDVSFNTKPLQDFSYIERGSLFYESHVHDGIMYDQLGRMLNYLGPWSVDSEYVYDLYYYSDTGEYSMDYGEEKIGEDSYYYTRINLTKDEYENNKSQLKAYLEENNAITPEMVSEEEILKMLE